MFLKLVVVSDANKAAVEAVLPSKRSPFSRQLQFDTRAITDRRVDAWIQSMWFLDNAEYESLKALTEPAGAIWYDAAFFPNITAQLNYRGRIPDNKYALGSRPKTR